MMKIKEIVGYVMTVYSFAFTIWVLSNKQATKGLEFGELVKKVETIQETMLTTKDIEPVIDSIAKIQLDVRKVTFSQNALRNSYVAFVKRAYTENKPLTFEEFVQYMQGIEFQLNIPKIDTSSFKISIRKKDGKKP